MKPLEKARIALRRHLKSLSKEEVESLKREFAECREASESKGVLYQLGIIRNTKNHETHEDI